MKGVSLHLPPGARRIRGHPDDPRLSHRQRGSTPHKIIIPDSAHGTNPATTAMTGLQVVEIKSDANGDVDLNELHKVCGDDVAGMMITCLIHWACSSATSRTSWT